MRCTLTETGPIAPTEVWQRYVDLDAWPRWAPLITAVEAEPRTLVAGLTGTVVGPGGLRVRFVVDEVEPPARTWSWRARLGVLRLALHHTVLDGPSGGTTTTLELVGSAPVVLGYLLPARLALRSLVR